jgi:hypothetical protein
MDQATVDLLTRRIDQLERSNRRLKLGGLVGVLLVSALLLVGWQEVQEELRATAFITENGYAFLRQADDGNPWLDITALKGPNSDIVLAAYDDSELTLSMFQDRSKRARLKAALAPNGSPYVALADAEGDVLASFQIFDNGNPAVWLSSPNSNAHTLIQSFSDGEMTIGVWGDLNKPPRVALGVLPDGTPFINMRNANGDVTWSAGSEGTAPRAQPTTTTLPLPPILR